jgi:hypothetical protein
MKNMNVKFNVREYVDSYYGEKVLEWYEEDVGLNGLDYLWSLGSKEEVDEVLGDYCL